MASLRVLYVTDPATAQTTLHQEDCKACTRSRGPWAVTTSSRTYTPEEVEEAYRTYADEPWARPHSCCASAFTPAYRKGQGKA